MSLILSGTDGLSDVDGTAATPAIRGTDANTGIFFPAADTIAFSEGGVEAARIDSSGNFGLGVTPSAWQVNNRALQLLEGFASISSNNSQGCCDVAFNCFNAGSAATSGWKYTNTGVAVSLFQQQAGAFKFLTAASGTAGNTITFTQAMTLDASGNLGVGTSSPSGKLDVRGTVIAIPAAVDQFGFQMLKTGTSTTIAGFYQDATNNGLLALYNTSAQQSVSLSGASANALTLDSSGNLLVGSSAAYSGTEIMRLTRGGVNWFTGPNSVNGGFDILRDGTTGVFLASGATAWSGLSDETSKDIIEPIENALVKVSSLRAVIGKYKIDEEGTRRSFLIAQDVQAVLPEAVNENQDGKLGLQYTDVIPLLVAAIKEQQALITQLTARITALEGA